MKKPIILDLPRRELSPEHIEKLRENVARARAIRSAKARAAKIAAARALVAEADANGE